MRTPDLALQYLGTPCYKEHSGWRYRRGGRCVECARIRTRDQRALVSDRVNATRPARRDEFRAAIDRAAEHMYKAGLEIWHAKDMQVRGWREALARHGLTQKTAAELRRYAYKRDTGQDWKTKAQAKKEQPGAEPAGDWLDE